MTGSQRGAEFFFSILTIWFLFWPCVASVYRDRLQHDWKGENFFDAWQFFTESDPTHSCVQYVSKAEAETYGLINTTSSTARIGVDTANIYSSCWFPSGRKSVRIESIPRFNEGLFVLDIEHMPTGCGTWPAWWSYGDEWPNNGEIDVIENVHTATHNHMRLHTNQGCDMGAVSDSGANDEWAQFEGEWNTGWNGQPADNCYINAEGQYGNQGCSIADTVSSTSFGEAMNSAGGGVMVHEWLPEHGIRFWWFERSAIPSDVQNGNPDPSNWGTPVASFPFGDHCPFTHFKGTM